MKLSLCLTTYNRYEMLLEAFSQVIDHERLDEIIIVDDCSHPRYFNKIRDLPRFNPKIKVFRQLENRGMSRNKADAISYASNEWVIIFDSDNIMKPDYLEAIPLDLVSNTIYCPCFASPNFDYRSLSRQVINRHNINIEDNTTNMLMNTCNYVVPKDQYLEVYEENQEMRATDTIWFNYLWLKANNDFFVMPGCEYDHRVHEGSGFLQEAEYNMRQAEKIRQLIRKL
jgi:glycosyltransferase involved in cell wall biosynthesis